MVLAFSPEQNPVRKWVKFVLGFLLILTGLLSCLLAFFAGFVPRSLIEIGSLTQVSIFSFAAGVYLMWARGRKWLPGISKILVILAILFGGLYIYSNLIPGVPRRIREFPQEALSFDGQTQSNGQYEALWGEYNTSLGRHELSFKDTQTGEVHAVTNKPRSAALGEDFAVWVAEAGAKREGSALEFDVWKYDFATKKETLLMERFDNKLNPNAPPVAVFGRKALFATFQNKLIILDVDTKEVEDVPMFAGYEITPSSSIHIVNEKAVMTGSLAGSYRGDIIFLYDFDKKNFRKVYEIFGYSGYQLGEIRSTADGKIYWQESAMFRRTKYYTMWF